jgi:hypothetical protein
MKRLIGATFVLLTVITQPVNAQSLASIIPSGFDEVDQGIWQRGEDVIQVESEERDLVGEYLKAAKATTAIIDRGYCSKNSDLLSFFSFEETKINGLEVNLCLRKINANGKAIGSTSLYHDGHLYRITVISSPMNYDGVVGLTGYIIEGIKNL